MRRLSRFPHDDYYKAKKERQIMSLVFRNRYDVVKDVSSKIYSKLEKGKLYFTQSWRNNKNFGIFKARHHHPWYFNWIFFVAVILNLCGNTQGVRPLKEKTLMLEDYMWLNQVR
mgnify:CR=1 FL=1